MNQKKISRKQIEVWPFIRYGVPIAIILFFMGMTELKDVGQFIKFLLFDVIAVNFLGIVFLAAGGFTICFVSYLIIRKKAHRPKTVVLPTLLVTALFLALGYGLAHDAINDFADVGSFLIGNVSEEYVVIEEFRLDVTPSKTFYSYTFDDGRTFIEGYEGKGFGSVQEGERYYIRYLPRSQKLLRMERLH
ncbi:hypothetical protein JSQ81_11430 [Sporosarcina sp. Marseille-Q4063]|uniref:hypothetical protein n=1 Tax=Sporosarcina sp. Marseille-Q4063 TaxID=2810514 RepID=UPI001BAEE782|nr:hypothetical protein [Sporosarcina sp. Marseille-Q4063]QUW20473.1 hypothetical protein JSQ81_11430 [Sporosarcina sp. Marseille-Q4063]